MSNNPFDFPKSKIPVPESPYLNASRAGFLSDLSDQVFFDESIPMPIESIPKILDKPPPYSYGPRPPGFLQHHDISVPNPGSSTRSRKRRDRVIKHDEGIPLPKASSDYVEAKLEELLGPRSRLDSVLDGSVDDLLLQSLTQSRSLEDIQGRRSRKQTKTERRPETPEEEDYIPFSRISERIDRKKSLSNSKLNENFDSPRSPGLGRVDLMDVPLSKKPKASSKRDRPLSRHLHEQLNGGSSNGGNLISLGPSTTSSTHGSPKKSPSKGGTQGGEKKSPSKSSKGSDSNNKAPSDASVKAGKAGAGGVGGAGGIVADLKKTETVGKIVPSVHTSPAKQNATLVGGAIKEDVAKGVAAAVLAGKVSGGTPAGGATPAAGLSPSKSQAGGSKRGSAKGSPTHQSAVGENGVPVKPALAGTDVAGADLNKLQQDKVQVLLKDSAAAFKLLRYCQKAEWTAADIQLKQFEKAIANGSDDTRPLSGIFDEVINIKSYLKFEYLLKLNS